MKTILTSDEICKSRLSSVEESNAFARNSGGKLLVTEPDNVDFDKESLIGTNYRFNDFLELSREILDYGKSEFKLSLNNESSLRSKEK
jgi:hypothetical protein